MTKGKIGPLVDDKDQEARRGSKCKGFALIFFRFSLVFLILVAMFTKVPHIYILISRDFRVRL